MCAQLRLHYRMVSLLLLGVLVSVISGITGAYFTLFGDISVTENRTAAFDRAVEVLREAYDKGQAPKPFRDWALAGAAVYGLFLLFYYVCACSTIWRRCAERARALADERGWNQSSTPRYRHASGRESVSLDDASTSLDTVHTQLRNFNERHSSPENNPDSLV